MAFVVSILAVQTLLTVCLFFAVSQIHARVVSAERQRERPLSAVATTSAASTLAMADLPPRTRHAAQTMGALRLLVVSPGCAACDTALDGLESSVGAATTLVVSGFEVPTSGGLRSVVDEDLARELASKGATFPLLIELGHAEHQHSS